MTEEELILWNQERKNDQCLEYGYYEVTQGYRKIPGNICTGGIDLSPYRYQCGGFGFFSRIFSLKGIFLIIVGSVVCYLGWPIVEALLLLTPIPDPTNLKNKAGNFASSGFNFVKSIPGMLQGDAPDRAAYQQNFDNAPGNMEDEEDDEEEDIGRNAAANDLNYDSDEKDETGDGDNTELISLDKQQNSKKKVPKLRKPK